MAGSVLSVLTDVMKNMYVGTLHEQLNNEVLALQILQLDSNNIDLVGLKAVIALHTGRTSGVGSRDELDTLPTAGNQGYKSATYDLKYHYGRIQVSGQALQKTKNNVGAFLSAWEGEMNGVKNDLVLNFARQVYGSGDGIVATTSGTGAGATTITLTSAEPISHGFLYPGQLIDIGTVANPTASASAVTISDVDEANTQIILTANATWSNADVISVSGSNKANATKEMDAGLQKLVATAANTVGTLDASATKIWDNLRDTGGGAISLSNLMVNVNKVRNKGVQLKNLKALSSPGIARRLFETAEFKSNVRFVNTQTLGAGFEELSFSQGAGTVTLVTDRLSPWGKLFMLPVENLRLFSPAAGFDTLAKDGQPVKWVQDKDAFQSVLYRYANMGTNRRNNCLVMSGLTDTGY